MKCGGLSKENLPRRATIWVGEFGLEIEHSLPRLFPFNHESFEIPFWEFPVAKHDKGRGFHTTCAFPVLFRCENFAMEVTKHLRVGERG